MESKLLNSARTMRARSALVLHLLVLAPHTKPATIATITMEATATAKLSVKAPFLVEATTTAATKLSRHDIAQSQSDLGKSSLLPTCISSFPAICIFGLYHPSIAPIHTGKSDVSGVHIITTFPFILATAIPPFPLFFNISTSYSNMFYGPRLPRLYGTMFPTMKRSKSSKKKFTTIRPFPFAIYRLMEWQCGICFSFLKMLTHKILHSSRPGSGPLGSC